MKKLCFVTYAFFLFAACKTTNKVTQSATSTTKISISSDSKAVQTIHLPVFVPVQQLQKQLYDNFFAANYGKYYPCEGRTDCSDLYKDLYIEDPILKIKGNSILLKLHLAGQVNALVFHPDVSGDIMFTGNPVIKSDTLFFQDIKMERSSQSFLLSVASKLFEKQIIKKIQANAWYSFRPTLDKYTTDFQKQMPIKWESSVLLLSLKKIYLNAVALQEVPNEGITADFTAELATEPNNYGQ
jgi:hypothetical protein